MRNDQPTNLGDIDPAQVDVATDPKPKRAKRQVQQMPNMLGPWAKKAEARMNRRPASPGIMLEPTGEPDEFVPASPHDNDDVWQIQIHDAFGTRSPAAVRVFIEQLRALCGQTWDGEQQQWRPSETEITAAVNFINSVQPRNEPEAALAAQMLAVHLMSMRMAAQALRTGDPHSTSLAGKLGRRRQAPVPPTVLARPEPDRAGLRQAQAPDAKGLRTIPRGNMAPRRLAPRCLPTGRVPQLPPQLRICVSLMSSDSRAAGELLAVLADIADDGDEDMAIGVNASAAEVSIRVIEVARTFAQRRRR